MRKYTTLRTLARSRQSGGSLPAEVDEDPAEVVGVLVNAVVERLDLALVEKPKDALLQLTRSFARNDLDDLRLLGDRFIDDPSQGAVDLVALVVDLMEVKLELHSTMIPDGHLAGRGRPEAFSGRAA